MLELRFLLGKIIAFSSDSHQKGDKVFPKTRIVLTNKEYRAILS